MPKSLLPSFFLVILLCTAVLAESKIICARQDGVPAKSICRPRFAALKNSEYRSMLQAIADRFVLAFVWRFNSESFRQVPFTGSFAFRRPSDQIPKMNSPPFSYQDIMHNLLMKNPS